MLNAIAGSITLPKGPVGGFCTGTGFVSTLTPALSQREREQVANTAKRLPRFANPADGGRPGPGLGWVCAGS